MNCHGQAFPVCGTWADGQRARRKLARELRTDDSLHTAACWMGVVAFLSFVLWGALRISWLASLVEDRHWPEEACESCGSMGAAVGATNNCWECGR